MQSIWLDESDFPSFNKDDKELVEKLNKIGEKWVFEFDTPQNREKMKNEFSDIIQKHYLPHNRNLKIEDILNDKKDI